MGAEWFRAWLGCGLLVSSVAAAGPAEPASVSFRAAGAGAELRVRAGTAVKVEEGTGPVVVVHVVGASASRRVDRLPLDTSAFGTALTRVDVKPEPAGLVLRLSVSQGARVAANVDAAGGVVVRVEAAGARDSE
jgi:hypothetical protein